MDSVAFVLSILFAFGIFCYLCVNDQSGGQPWALGPAYIPPSDGSGWQPPSKAKDVTTVAAPGNEEVF
jgi:hypothetical protein